MISLYVNPATKRSTVTCSHCPSWRPTFDDEPEAWEIGHQHDVMSHGADPDAPPQPMKVMDIVIAARVGVLDTGDQHQYDARVKWLTQTLGEIVQKTVDNDQLRQAVAILFSTQLTFTKTLDERLDFGFSLDEAIRLAQTWPTEAPE